MRIYLGCAAYHEMKPATAASRERVIWEWGRAGPFDNIDLAGAQIDHGYGACRNVEALLDAALAEVGEEGFLLYHDADMVFTPDSVKAICAVSREVQPWHPAGAVVAARYFASAARDGEDRRIIVGDEQESFRDVPGVPPHAVARRIGFGFVLIPLRLLRHFARPWVREEWNGETLTTPDTIFCGRTKLVEGAEVYLAIIPGVRHHVTHLEELE